MPDDTFPVSYFPIATQHQFEHTKRRMAGERVAYEQLLHDQIELTHLATFLPELWAEFGRDMQA